MKSDESAFSIVPSKLSSRFSFATGQTSRCGSADDVTTMEYHPLSFEDDLFTARVYKRNYRSRLSQQNQKQSPRDGPSAITAQTAKHQSKEEIDKTQTQRPVGKAKTTTNVSSEKANEGAKDDAKHTPFVRNGMLVTKIISENVSIKTEERSHNLDDSNTLASASYTKLVQACSRGEHDLVKEQLAMMPVRTPRKRRVPTLLGSNNSGLIYFCPITAAVFCDQVEVMQTLLQRAELEKDLDRVVEKVIGGNGIRPWRPLHVATLKRNLSMVELLLQNGASVCSEIGNGIQATHLAARLGYLEILSTLEDYGADLEREDQNGLTPRKYNLYFSTPDNSFCMRMAAELRYRVHPALIRQIDSTWDANAPWPYKSLPERSLQTLDIAIRLGLPSLVEKHIEDGFDPNHCRDDGGTGLHTLVWRYCATSNRDEAADNRILRLLLEVVELFDKDKNGKTIFDIVCSSIPKLDSRAHTMNRLARLIAENLPKRKYAEKAILISRIHDDFCSHLSTGLTGCTCRALAREKPLPSPISSPSPFWA